MDKNYWEEIYARQNEEMKPSLFAEYIVKYIDDTSKKILELGCGNGRDSIYFANEKFNVVAVDQCKNAIDFLNYRFMQLENIKFLCGDFTKMDDMNDIDVVYSRFTLHSISEIQEKRVLQWVYKNLMPDGLFCVEVRGQKNEIYGLGEMVENEPDAFIYNNHYRRFINFDTFCNKLINKGFVICYAEEKNGFAPYNGEDETYIRVIAKKQ